MDLREALSQISEIRQQIARSQIFRGYRAIPVAMTGVLGIVAACLQTTFVSEPAQHLNRYLLFWIAIAWNALFPMLTLANKRRTSIGKRRSEAYR